MASRGRDVEEKTEGVEEGGLKCCSAVRGKIFESYGPRLACERLALGDGGSEIGMG
jgi:hypothetical protein